MATPSGSKLKNAFSELAGLYGTSKYRYLALICHFSFFVSSLSYYVTGMYFNEMKAIFDTKLTSGLISLRLSENMELRYGDSLIYSIEC